MANKYFARKVTHNGITFDSKAEYRRWCELTVMQAGKLISGLKVHPKYTLIKAFPYYGRTIRKVEYTPDFEYIENGRKIVEDVKSSATMTQASRLRMKLFMSVYPEVQLRIVEV